MITTPVTPQETLHDHANLRQPAGRVAAARGRFLHRHGLTFNPASADENATCLILGENIFAMLLVKPFFQGFSHKGICDTANAAETITALAVSSRAEVDALVSKARAAGGQIDGEAKDYGVMYQHGFADPDGHLWEVFHSSGAPG
ncbi:VOC family protein [Xanthomonas prunicola]|uniref:VOC family protein n=1 Tax=Xanthomonas prunicola TaxID=2053930 RepID=UPI003CCE05E7